jgi:glycerophosphoryl diester phosphodiesterase
MKGLAVTLLTLATMALDAAPKILVHGHRGARAVRPENTLPAFEYAIKTQVDVLELDVNVTADNQLVVSHDGKMNRKICRGPEGETLIRKLTLAQVREWDCGALRNPDFPQQELAPGTKMPTLDEVLALAPRGGFQFNIETKMDQKVPANSPAPEEFARLLVEAIRRHRLESRAIVQSFDFRTLAAVKTLAPEIRRSALYAGLPRDFVRISQEAGDAPIVSPQYMLVTKAKVRAAHKAKLGVVAWTANSERAWEKLIKAEVDAIISDDPAALIAYLKKKGLR